jgi:TrwC relaxase
VYRAQLAREVQRLGYEISIAGKDGRWELEGYAREQVMAFSLRRQEIERELAKPGVNGTSAAHRSRLSKDQCDEETLKAEWRERAAAYGIPVRRIAQLALNHKSIAPETGPCSWASSRIVPTGWKARADSSGRCCGSGTPRGQGFCTAATGQVG